MASSVPLMRVSRSGVLGQLQVRSLFAHRSAKLPKVRAMLAAHCETVQAFQLRRLVAVIRSKSAGVQSGDLALLRAANINVDRSPIGVPRCWMKHGGWPREIHVERIQTPGSRGRSARLD
jgi:hypothetical protein